MISGPFFENRVIPLFQKELAAWSVYHDLRVDPKAPIRQAAITRPERRVSPDGENLISVMHTLYTGERKFKKDINAFIHPKPSQHLRLTGGLVLNGGYS